MQYIVVKSEVVDGKRKCSFEQQLDTLSEVDTFKDIKCINFSTENPITAPIELGTLYFLSEEIDASMKASFIHSVRR